MRLSKSEPLRAPKRVKSGGSPMQTASAPNSHRPASSSKTSRTARPNGAALDHKRNPLSPTGGEGWGEGADARAPAALTLPALRAGPLPLPHYGRGALLRWRAPIAAARGRAGRSEERRVGKEW